MITQEQARVLMQVRGSALRGNDNEPLRNIMRLCDRVLMWT